jgi:hypothetical protein
MTGQISYRGLRLDGDGVPGHCDAHGLFTAPLARRVLGAEGREVAGVLAAACPVCGAEFSVPPQSVPALRAAAMGRLRSDGVPIRARVPLIALDALDLACWRTAPSDAPLLRGKLLGERALAFVRGVREGNRGGEAQERIERLLSALPAALLGQRRLVTFKISPEAEAEIRRIRAESWSSLGDILAALCLSSAASEN